MLACLAYFTASADYGVDFGLSILWFVLFTPMSFVCWYRPVYKAFRYTALRVFDFGCYLICMTFEQWKWDTLIWQGFLFLFLITLSSSN